MRLRLSSKEKGKKALELLLDKNVELIKIQDSFSINSNTIETYILEYIKSLDEGEYIRYLNLLAKQNILPSFKAAKILLLSGNSLKTLKKMYHFSPTNLKRATEFIDNINYYKNLLESVNLSLIEDRPKKVHPISRYSFI